MIEGCRIQVRGTIRGVGFRPRVVSPSPRVLVSALGI